jgi:hypothetical protein
MRETRQEKDRDRRKLERQSGRRIGIRESGRDKAREG